MTHLIIEPHIYSIAKITSEHTDKQVTEIYTVLLLAVSPYLTLNKIFLRIKEKRKNIYSTNLWGKESTAAKICFNARQRGRATNLPTSCPLISSRLIS